MPHDNLTPNGRHGKVRTHNLDVFVVHQMKTTFEFPVESILCLRAGTGTIGVVFGPIRSKHFGRQIFL